MAQHGVTSENYALNDGAKVAVVGGGPTGSFFSIFALKMAGMLGREIDVTIFDPKDFSQEGPGSCNKCGGIISELLVQTLAVEGINLPESTVRKGINSYELHTSRGRVSIATPSFERTIATVYRGGGPKGAIGEHKESFDRFLLDTAIAGGAVHEPEKVDRVDYSGEKPVLFNGERRLFEADLVVGACGVNSRASGVFEGMDFGYRTPSLMKTAITEMSFGESIVDEHFGNAIHLFLLPMKEVKFAAMIPKGSYVTLCILGSHMSPSVVDEFMEHPVVKNALPRGVECTFICRCFPNMNIRAPKAPFADRVVMCGDAGSTRLFKDGLGAAYLMGKAAAKTAVFDGVGRHHFHETYLPVYRSIITDNRFGGYLYAFTDLFRKYSLLTKGMLEVVRTEQEEPENKKRLSSILWDMFTGNERYKNIFRTAASLPLHLDLWRGCAKIVMRRDS
jgi:flavin-dependent dehydrogenase